MQLLPEGGFVIHLEPASCSGFQFVALCSLIQRRSMARGCPLFAQHVILALTACLWLKFARMGIAINAFASSSEVRHRAARCAATGADLQNVCAVCRLAQNRHVATTAALSACAGHESAHIEYTFPAALLSAAAWHRAARYIFATAVVALSIGAPLECIDAGGSTAGNTSSCMSFILCACDAV
jgi:hypothetical protein